MKVDLQKKIQRVAFQQSKRRVGAVWSSGQNFSGENKIYHTSRGIPIQDCDISIIYRFRSSKHILNSRFPPAMERIATWIPSKRPQHTKNNIRKDSSFVTHQGLHLSLEVVLPFWVCVQVRDALVPRFPVFVALASA